MRNTLLSYYIGLLLAGACASIAAQDGDRFAALLGSCAACHGTDGVGVMPGAPSLGGQNEPYLIESLRELKGEHGHSAIMRGVTTELEDDDLQQLARYYASLPYVRPPQTFDADRAARGEKIYARMCGICHLASGRATAYEEFPLLAGQSIDYMLNEVDHIVSGRRNVEITKRGLIATLARADLEDAVHYFASQQVTPDQVSTSRIKPNRRLKRAR